MMFVNALQRLKKRNLEGWGWEDGVLGVFHRNPRALGDDKARACLVSSRNNLGSNVIYIARAPPDCVSSTWRCR